MNISTILDCLGLNIGFDINGDTLLHIAAHTGNKELAKLLITLGFSLCVKNLKGLTPRELCDAIGDCEMSNLLKKEEETANMINAVIEGDLLAFNASIINNADIYRIFKYKPFIRANVIHYIAAYNIIDMLKSLCVKNIDLNVKNDVMYETAMHIAAQYDYYELIDVLLQHNSDINARDAMYWTPLHRAVINNSINALHALLRHNASVDTEDISGESPIQSAVKNGNSILIKILSEAQLKRGAK